MLENCQSAQERWGGVNKLIDRWLQERRQLIVQYYDLSTNEAPSNPETFVQALKQFCQILVDYVSAGHFEIYEQLLEEAKEFADGSEEVATRVIPKIEKTTATALDFNDQVDLVDKEDDAIDGLKPALSALGQTLEDRFELEDLMIKEMHGTHARQIA